MMVQDMIQFTKLLEKLLKNDLRMKMWKPVFTPMGSVPEGTQIGLGNEMDVMIEFKNPPFYIVEACPRMDKKIFG
jgi:hypothetical protein